MKLHCENTPAVIHANREFFNQDFYGEIKKTLDDSTEWADKNKK